MPVHWQSFSELQRACCDFGKAATQGLLDGRPTQPLFDPRALLRTPQLGSRHARSLDNPGMQPIA